MTTAMIDIRDIIPKVLASIEEPQKVANLYEEESYSNGGNDIFYEDEHWLIDGYYVASGVYDYCPQTYWLPDMTALERITSFRIGNIEAFYDDEIELSDKELKPLYDAIYEHLAQYIG